MDREQPQRKVPILALICACLTVALGLLTFVGWLSGVSVLASVRSKYIPMAPSTALCFSLIGVGITVQILRPISRWLPRLLAGVVFLVALAKLVEFLSGMRFDIDAWFVQNPGTFGAVQTGRMAPITALTFLFAAEALVRLAGDREGEWAGVFGAIVITISAIVLVGYWYGTPLLYGGSVIPVALPTAVAFFLCGVAFVIAAGPEQWPLRLFYGSSTRALLLRVFLPLIVAAALVNGWVNTSLLKYVHANPAVAAAVCAIAFAALLGWIISQVSLIVGGRIDRAEEARSAAQTELVALNADLENRVQERTRELREKNRQMAEELQMARELQLALLPQQFPTVPTHVPADQSALRFLSLYFPTGDVSGDFFSVFPVGEKAAGVFICDVMGHGVRSALITSMIRALMEEHAQATTDPGELLTRVNKALTLILKQAGTTMFATCFYLVADVNAAELRFANAGHPSALHIRQGNGAAEKLQGPMRNGPALGFFPSASYQTSTRPMAKGDLVMLFTDGLFEVEDPSGNPFSQEQLRAAAHRHAAHAPEEFFSRVVRDVREFARRESFDDDVCVVGFQVHHID
jgi:serine phosphatase RsbU (regulator of sigma subunit)